MSGGVLGWGVHLPYRRLDLSTVSAIAGKGGRKGTRTVASYDEDTTTMAVEAARCALRDSPVTDPTLWFTTTTPAYLDKTNATAIHAALRLDRTVPAYDSLGAARSWVGALRAGLDGSRPALVVAADIRTGLPGGPDEATGADAAAAFVVGPPTAGPMLAELVAEASLTEEFLERWRTPDEAVSRSWEERFGEQRYVPLGTEVLKMVLGAAAADVQDVNHLVVSGLHGRAAAAVAAASGVPTDRIADRLSTVVGNPGAAQAALLLATTLERAEPGQLVALVSLADGADALLFRTTRALADHHPSRPVAAQIAAGGPVPYGTYLAWRGLLPVEPPRRQQPARPSAPASARSSAWKYGFVGSESGGGEVHLPPAPTDIAPRPMAAARGTVVTFTIDRLAYSPSPPIVFAVVDFESGGRLPVELTDVDAAEVAPGMPVEMTFRRLFTADGIHNYFWKARPVRGEAV